MMSSQELASNNNQVPEGYKKTEVGVIPEDWEVRPLRSALKTSPKYGINAAAVPHQGDIPAYIRITDISEDGYFKPEKLVGVAHCSSSQYFLEEGDLVFARTGASVGKSYLYNPGDGRLVYAGFLIKLQADKNVLLPDFFAQYVKTKTYWDWVKSMSMRSGQPGINGNEYGQLLLPFPSVSEQKAIAQTLSDVDALIDALDKLIAKKRNIKTATMQQLLTGKTRLPGFGEGKGYKKTEVGVIPEDWKICILSELSQIVTGQTPPTHNRSYYGDEYLFVSPADIGSQKYITNTFAKLSKLGFSISRKYPSKTILFTCIGSTIGKCAIVVTESTSNQQINAILPSNLVNHQYLYYQLINNAKKIKNRAATQAVPIINKTEFGSTFIVVCSDEEQKAIAQVLCDIDTEITALEKRRAKTQAIKQGMMQELLTGKTRLINN